MGDKIQYGIPKLPAPIFRLMMIRLGIIAFVTLSFVLFDRFGNELAIAVPLALLDAALVGVFVRGMLRERRLLREVCERDLGLCARCCTPFESDEPAPCTGCGRTLEPQEERRRWRYAVIVSPTGWFEPKPRAARIFPHWSVLVALGTLFLLFFFVRSPIERLIWPPNTQMVQTFTIPSSGNPQRTYQIPVQTRPPTVYLIVTLVLWFGLLFGTIISVAVRQYRVSRALRAAAKSSFLVCEKCSYPLPHDREGGACPECGHAYERHDLRRRWYLAYGLHKKREAVNMTIPLTPSRPEGPDAAP